MPLYFKQTKFKSFQRQLNLWGFARIKEGVDKGAVFHRFFVRGRPDLCYRMIRMKIKGQTNKTPTQSLWSRDIGSRQRGPFSHEGTQGKVTHPSLEMNVEIPSIAQSSECDKRCQENRREATGCLNLAAQGIINQMLHEKITKMMQSKKNCQDIKGLMTSFGETASSSNLPSSVYSPFTTSLFSNDTIELLRRKNAPRVMFVPGHNEGSTEESNISFGQTDQFQSPCQLSQAESRLQSSLEKLSSERILDLCIGSLYSLQQNKISDSLLGLSLPLGSFPAL